MENVYAAADRNARGFPRSRGSACVFNYVSTRFADGGESGSARIGISTAKFLARGPMDSRELTTYPYRVHGNGHINGVKPVLASRPDAS